MGNRQVSKNRLCPILVDELPKKRSALWPPTLTRCCKAGRRIVRAVGIWLHSFLYASPSNKMSWRALTSKMVLPKNQTKEKWVTEKGKMLVNLDRTIYNRYFPFFKVTNNFQFRFSFFLGRWWRWQLANWRIVASGNRTCLWTTSPLYRCREHVSHWSAETIGARMVRSCYCIYFF